MSKTDEGSKVKLDPGDRVSLRQDTTSDDRGFLRDKSRNSKSTQHKLLSRFVCADLALNPY